MGPPYHRALVGWGVPDYMRPQKEHDALGGVYAFLEEGPGSPDSREDAIRAIAENDVAHEYAIRGIAEIASPHEYAEDERLAIEELRLTYPVEEHEYNFVFDPPGKKATEWWVNTSKRPDGTWEGTIQRTTEKQTGVEDFETYFHEEFEQRHAASERALLNDLIDQAQRWRRRNPRKKSPRRGPKPGTGGRPPKFTAAEKKRIVKAYREGATAGEVGEEHGLSPITVLKFVREAGGEIRRGPSPGTGGRPATVTPAEKRKIVKEYGWATAEEVGERWGLTGATVLDFVREAGEEVRGRGIRPPKKRRRKKKAKRNPKSKKASAALFRRLMRV